MNDHLSDRQLIERLYGVEPHPHADSCPECAARYREIESRRADLAQPAPVSADFLAAQRRRIHARLEQAPHWGWKWAPAAAAAVAVVIGLAVYHPALKPAPRVDTGDAQLFSEVYSMEQSTEPRAAAPIHALFEDNQ